MSVSNLNTVLNKFGKQVVKESKTRLTKLKKNASKELYNSISYDFKEHKNSFRLSFEMDEYGKFVDKGVSGKNNSSFNGKNKEVFKSLGGFSFGTGNFKGKGGEWKKRIDKWMYQRSVSPRDKKSGKFIKRDTVNYLIRRSIYQHGSKASLFFTKPFESAFKSLPNDVVNAYGLDVEKFLKDVLK